MVQILAILAAIGSFVWSFFSPLWAWIPIGVVSVILLVSLAGLKAKKWRHIEDLSPVANSLFQKFGHYYTMPAAGRDFSGAASTLQFGGIAVGIVGAFHGNWWSLAGSLAMWFGMGAASVAFNPTNFLRDPVHRMAHEEIIAWITNRNRQGRA